MLDAFIIEKIRREQEHERSRRRPRLPLLPGGPPPPQRPLEEGRDPDREEERDGGAVIIDFTI
ncbi:MAG: hypothetical protein D6798_02940 [Deltaproteobacteria bacterium]|nr:MAG: hypothetical protein D6798_02940 [Deltaproteobacteria bacterium]